MGKGRDRNGGFSAEQSWPANPTQTLILDLWQQHGEAYQVQQFVDVSTDVGGNKKKERKMHT